MVRCWSEMSAVYKENGVVDSTDLCWMKIFEKVLRREIE